MKDDNELFVLASLWDAWKTLHGSDWVVPEFLVESDGDHMRRVGGRTLHDVSLSSQQLQQAPLPEIIGRVVLVMQEAFDESIHPFGEHAGNVMIEACSGGFNVHLIDSGGCKGWHRIRPSKMCWSSWTSFS